MIFRTLIVLGCFAWLSYFSASTSVDRSRPGDNPNKFHLWATNSAFTYTFTYDPHAADVWLFQSAGSPAPPETGSRIVVDSNAQGLRLTTFPGRTGGSGKE